MSRYILVNFTSTYHRRVAKQIIKKGGKIHSIYRIPNYSDPRGSVFDIEAGRDHYLEDEEFTDVEIINIYDMQSPEKLEVAFSKNDLVLNKEIIHDLRELEATFMRHSDRFTFFPISASQLRFIYYAITNLIYLVLSKNKDAIVVFADTPHVAFDTVIFYVAKYLNIKTIIFEKLHLDDVTILVEDYRYYSKVPEDYLDAKSLEELESLVQSFGYNYTINANLASKSLQRVWKKHDDINQTRNQSYIVRLLNIRERQLFKKGIGIVKKYLFSSKKYNSRKQYWRALVFNNEITQKEYRKATKTLRIHNNKLLYMFKKNIESIDYSASFVFFPLHMQPEKTTSAFGDVFEDQYLAIKILSQSLPKDMKIYVKEHPAQLADNRIENFHYRSKAYYERIKKIDKVKLLSFEESYQKLLENALFVGTIAGSVGWESMLRGKPVIVFGNPWYSICNSCYRVNSEQEIKHALKKLLSYSSEEVVKDVYKFIIYVKQNSFQFATNPRHVDDFSASYEEQIKQFAEAILNET